MAKNHSETTQIGRGVVSGSLLREGWHSRSLVGRDLGGGGLVNRGWRGGGWAETLDVLAKGNVEEDLLQLKPYIDRLAKADPKDIQEVAASQLQLMTGNYKIVLSQSRRYFFWALVTAGIGLFFFLIAAVYSIATGNAGAAIVPILSGAVIEGIAGLLFRLSGQVAAESRDFHAKVETVHRYLLANTISESLNGDMKEQIRAELARKIANIHFTSNIATSAKQPQGSGQA